MTNQKPKAYSYIRYSTPEQAKGGSEFRQTKAAKEYADNQNIQLVPLRDLGVSGYSGKHISKGELGKFLDKIEEGQIAPNSKLIIESIDRLSRLRPSGAQKLLLNILEADIALVVLDYGIREITLKKYNNDPGVFYQLMGEIQRAYQESKRKADLLSNARESERNKAQNGGRKISGMPPMWLKFNNDCTKFLEQDEIVEAINLMFQKKANGKGAYKIEREMNENKKVYHPPKSKRNKSGAWRKSTINRYLKDRRLLGEYQPHKYIKHDDGSRERVKAGPLILDYYPQVIDPNLFYKVQAVFDANAKQPGQGGGRTGKVSNLFVHLAHCAQCGDTMRFQNKGKRQYLRCDNNIRGLGCDESETVRYDSIFEPLMLHYCRDLEVADILPGNEQRQSKLAVLQQQLQSVNGKLSDVKDKLFNLVDKLEGEDEDDPIMVRYKQRKAERDKLQARQKELKAQIQSLDNSAESTQQRLDNMRALIDKMQQLTGDKRKELRLSMQSKFKLLIDRLDVKFGSFKYNQAPYMAFKIQFTDGVTRTLFLVDDELTYIEDAEQEHAVTYRLQDGEVVDVDSSENRKKNIELDRKIAKVLNRT